MKGERNRIRALQAKALYGEGTEQATARRKLSELNIDYQRFSESRFYPEINHSSFNIPPDSEKGLAMEDVMQAYGDLFQERAINYNALTWICLAAILLFGLFEFLI